MSIGLAYDPMRPLTAVVIDGRAVKSSDIYGFLYPVRHHTLQAWLVPSGSWSGLARSLHDLSRGERIEVTFRGRECDFKDISYALEDEDGITLNHEAWDAVKDDEELLVQARRKLETMLTKPVTVEMTSEGNSTVRMEEVFPNTARYVKQELSRYDAANWDWLDVVESVEDLRKVAGRRTCVIVKQGYLDDFTRAENLHYLTRSLRRAQDMIVCEFTSNQELRNFQAYALQRGLGGLRFVLHGDEWKTQLMEKYGIPLSMHERLHALGDLCVAIEQRCFSHELEYRMRGRELRGNSNLGAIAEMHEIEYCLRWIAYMRSDFERISAMLTEEG